MNPKSLANLKPPFEKGNAANPGGKPVGSRNRLTAAFLNRLVDDFEEHGKGAIAECRKTDPSAYVRAIVALCPKEMEIKRPLGDLSDDDIARILAIVDSAATTPGLQDDAEAGTAIPTIN